MNQNQTPLLDAITDFIETKPAYFRIPGHRLDRGISPRWTDKVGKDIFSYDVTETPMTDDLHCPKTSIYQAQKLASTLYGADQSFFLVNGSTCGNEAMILSAACEGEPVMIARNAHKSVMMGLILSGAKPVYVMPEVLGEWGIQGGITPRAVKNCFDKNPGCKALLLVSPSYYGVCADLSAIADICHEYGALLLVDEAHGGHMYFHDSLPVGALAAGADMCVQSMHKVTGAMTQSSILHIKYHGVGTATLERAAENLHLVQSTSPSYLLMASLDCARYELAMHGTEMMNKALALAAWARGQINAIFGFRCMDRCQTGRAGIQDLDTTRLVISAYSLGLTGFALETLLFEKYAVNTELSDYQNVLAIVTYANEKEDLVRLVEACAEISRLYRTDTIEPKKGGFLPALDFPAQVLTPRKAYFSKTKKIPWKDAAGKISGQTIAPYPPGIPVLYPGEQISQQVWEYIEFFRSSGLHMHGTDCEGKLDEIKIIDE